MKKFFTHENLGCHVISGIAEDHAKYFAATGNARKLKF